MKKISGPHSLKITVECKNKEHFLKIMGPHYLEKYWVGKTIIKRDPEAESFEIKSVSYHDSLVDKEPTLIILVEYDILGD